MINNIQFYLYAVQRTRKLSITDFPNALDTFMRNSFDQLRCTTTFVRVIFKCETSTSIVYEICYDSKVYSRNLPHSS